MSRVLIYAVIFLALLSFEVGFLNTLPWPWSLTPLIPIVSVWIYHTWHSPLGIWFLLAWGFAMEWLNLFPWFSPLVVSVVIGLGVLLWVERLFSHRSLWGLFAVSLLSMGSWALVEGLFRLFNASTVPDVALFGFAENMLLRTLMALMVSVLLFFFEERIRRLGLRL
ncbi:hypothetical protein HYW18_03075 [Candidatus Uhrbacteria bacterium]|nr:hypothetical protein [Candidatus Uhrbacteria bacterium]